MESFMVQFLDAAVVVFLMWAAKITLDWKTIFDDDKEIEEQSNLSVGIRRAGFYLGMAIALMAPLSGESKGFATDLIYLVSEGIFAVIALFIAVMINDRIILFRLNNDKEVLGDNQAVSLVEFGHYVATGLIITVR
jgi:uncharacterized membrane protein YjfL (UPF0719 family)